MDDLILDLEHHAGHRQVALRRRWNRTLSAGGKKKKKRRDRVRHQSAAPSATASASPLEQEYDGTKATLAMNVQR